jgi:hypothetical protein
MTPYKNLSGNSGVEEYEIGPDFIRVKFRKMSKLYLYNHASAGASNIEEMKSLAEAGQGLATFISQNVRDDYVR